MKKITTVQLLAAGALCLLVGFAVPRLLPGLIAEGPAGWLTGFGVGVGASLVFAALLRRYLPDPCDAAPKPLRQRYVREMMAAMAVYVVTLMLSVWLFKRMEMAPLLRTAVALAPVLPIVFVLRAMIRYIRDVDEMQQRIELEAVSIGTAMLCVLYMGAGFLQTSKVIDVPAGTAMTWVFPLACLFYGLAKVVVSRRFG